MEKTSIVITKTTASSVDVAVQAKPRVDEMHTSLQALRHEEVQAIAMALPAALASEFMLVQTLSFLRREGKSITVRWTDHPPSPNMTDIIESLIR